jgi:hypothetical protein
MKPDEGDKVGGGANDARFLPRSRRSLPRSRDGTMRASAGAAPPDDASGVERSGNNAPPADASSVARSRTNNSPTPVILCISPAQVGKQTGYIHLASGELAEENAIRAYFDSAGREVSTLPCPNFEGFLLANSLRTRNVSFLMDLPAYILRMGCQILAENAYSDDARPDLSWLPRAPSSASTPSETLVSGEPCCSASRPPQVTPSHPPNVTMRARFPSSSHLDPEVIDPPLIFTMGSPNRSSVLSPFHPVTFIQSGERYCIEATS